VAVLSHGGKPLPRIHGKLNASYHAAPRFDNNARNTFVDGQIASRCGRQFVPHSARDLAGCAKERWRHGDTDAKQSRNLTPN